MQDQAGFPLKATHTLSSSSWQSRLGSKDAALPSVQVHGGTGLQRMLKQPEQNQIILVTISKKFAQVS